MIYKSRSKEEIIQSIKEPINVSPHIVAMVTRKGFEPIVAAFPVVTALGLPMEMEVNSPSGYIIGWRKNNQNLDLLFATHKKETENVKISDQGRVKIYMLDFEFMVKVETSEQTQYDDEAVLFNGTVKMDSIDEQELLLLEKLLNRTKVSEANKFTCLGLYKSPEEQKREMKIGQIALGVALLLVSMGVLATVERSKREREICEDLANGMVPGQISSIQKFKAGSDRLKVKESFDQQVMACKQVEVSLPENSETIKAHQELVRRTIALEGKLPVRK